ncbi:MAG: restriction endonuclease subunit S [Opitutaceae bacterium]
MAGKWHDVALEDVAAELTVGYVGPMASEYVDDGIPFLRSLNVEPLRINKNDLKFITPEFHQRIQKSRLTPGDVVIVRTGKPGACSVVPEWLTDGNCSDLVIVRCGKELNNRFLAYYINTVASRHVAAHLVGAVQQHFNVGSARTLRLNLPPIAEQKAIAAILGSLDEKIELNRRMNATLEAMARALFRSWFVDFDPVRAKLDGRRPANLNAVIAALFPEHLEQSSIGKKPVGWEVTTLETTLSVLETGGRPKGGVGGITTGVPSIGAESIVGIGQFDFGKTKFVPVEFFDGMNKGHIESHDVLLYKDGGRPGEYEPHVSMFGDGFPFEKCSINEHVYRLRANERLSQEYLYFWLTTELALAEMRIKGTGVAIPGLNSTAVRSLAMLVPPRPLVNAFTRQAAPLVTQLLANAKQSRTLAILRDTLLPKLLSGEIRPAT